MRWKKVWAVLALSAALMGNLAGCGRQEDTAEGSEETAAGESGVSGAENAADSEETGADANGTSVTADAADSEETDAGERASGEASTEAAEASGGILIAYFTAAENSGVDAEASASYSQVDGEPKGRMQALAEMIQENVGGDLFSIRTEETYPADGAELIDYAAKEQDADARPELVTHIDDLSKYDTIFLGYPNWWADLPQPLYTFLEEYDLSGKTIIPFNSHNGSRFSNTIETIQELQPNATVIEDGFTINERDVPEAAEDVAQWLQGLGY